MSQNQTSKKQNTKGKKAASGDSFLLNSPLQTQHTNNKDTNTNLQPNPATKDTPITPHPTHQTHKMTNISIVETSNKVDQQ